MTISVPTEKGERMRLIDADAIKYREERGGGGRDFPENIVTEDEIAKQPTVAAEPVIRCKDCKHRNRYYCYHPEQKYLAVDIDYYCARGERRES
jgi:hypothetical protein